MNVCHVCSPPTDVIQVSLSRTSQLILVDAIPHSAGLYAVRQLRDGWSYGYPLGRSESPLNGYSRHRKHIHRTEKESTP